MYVEMMSTSNGVLGKGPNRAFVMVVKLGKVEILFSLDTQMMLI